MPVLIIHDTVSAKNLYHQFKRDKEKGKLKIESFARDLIEEFIDWLYENNLSIMQSSK